MQTEKDIEWPGIDVKELVKRLRLYNEWRRGAETKQPDPETIGIDIDEAANMLEEMSRAIEKALNANLHLADGDDCTLFDLVRIAK